MDGVKKLGTSFLDTTSGEQGDNCLREGMTMRLGELDLEEAAEQAAGNWQEFDCLLVAPGR